MQLSWGGWRGWEPQRVKLCHVSGGSQPRDGQTLPAVNKHPAGREAPPSRCFLFNRLCWSLGAGCRGREVLGCFGDGGRDGERRVISILLGQNCRWQPGAWRKWPHSTESKICSEKPRITRLSKGQKVLESSRWPLWRRSQAISTMPIKAAT